MIVDFLFWVDVVLAVLIFSFLVFFAMVKLYWFLDDRRYKPEFELKKAERHNIELQIKLNECLKNMFNDVLNDRIKEEQHGNT